MDKEGQTEDKRCARDSMAQQNDLEDFSGVGVSCWSERRKERG